MSLTRHVVDVTGLWQGLVLFLGSLPFLFWGWKAYHQVAAYTASQAHTTGQVVALIAQQRTGPDGTPRTYYYPVVEFSTPAGNVIRFQDNTGVDRPALAPQKGEVVDVLYDPENPKVATIASWWNLWLLPSLLLGVGSLFALLGVWFLLDGLFSLLLGITTLFGRLFNVLLRRDRE